MSLRVGVLHDVSPAGHGETFARLFEQGFAGAFGPQPPRLELIGAVAEGAPRAGEAAVRAAFASLIGDDVVAVVGPAISDSALAILHAVDAAGCPTINYAGSHRARGRWMFQYQVGSLEEEPYLLARHLASRGLHRVAVVRETSIIGGELFGFLEDASRRDRVELRAVADIGRDGAGADVAADVVRDAGVDAVVYLGLGLSARALGEVIIGAQLPVVANSALMFGHAMPESTRFWEGWTYVDVFAEDNTVLAELRRSGNGGTVPTFAVPYDLGRLLGAAAARAPSLDRAGIAAGLQLVKRLPSALGREGTVMGFGNWERGALKGEYLVLRTWRSGVSEPAESR